MRASESNVKGRYASGRWLKITGNNSGKRSLKEIGGFKFVETMTLRHGSSFS